MECAVFIGTEELGGVFAGSIIALFWWVFTDGSHVESTIAGIEAGAG